MEEGENVDKSCMENPSQENSENVCIICDKHRKFHKGHWQNLSLFTSREVINDLILTAKNLDDQALVNKIDSALSEDEMI